MGLERFLSINGQKGERIPDSRNNLNGKKGGKIWKRRGVKKFGLC